MKKVPIGGIIIDEELTLVRIYNLPDEPDWGGMALEEFCFHGMTVNFISENKDAEGHANMGITLQVKDKQMFENALAAVRKLHDEVALDYVSPVCLLTVYGPHFKERCGLAATAFRALGLKGINILGISTSISSISAIIHADDLDTAQFALEDVFEVP